MTVKEIPVDVIEITIEGDDLAVFEAVKGLRNEAVELYKEEKYEEALDKIVEGLRKLREYSDYSQLEFRTMLATLLFDLSEVHYELNDYKQSERELEVLFRVLDGLVKEDSELFGSHHLLAMDLSTRILRSRKKTLDLLAKQQINTGVLYEKVNAGVAAATDKLVDSLRKAAEMMAQTGDYRGAVRFYMEAIKIAKKRSGRVGRREVRMTVDMAKVMLHSKSETDRAKRLLNAVLPHAVSLENVELEQEILHLLEKIDADVAREPMWRSFMEKVQRQAKSGIRKLKKNVGKKMEDVEQDVEQKAEGVLDEVSAKLDEAIIAKESEIADIEKKLK